jgi:DnaA family protein
LLQAACAAAGSGGAYFSLSAAIRLPPESLMGFEASPVLCLDDLDAVAGNLGWERALFSLFNASDELHTRLLFAASAAPRSLAWSLEDWRSRAVASAVYQIHELDEPGRIEALALRAQQRGLQLPRETAEYLLRRVPRDLPSLLALLDALDGESLAARRRLTIPFIREALERTAETPPASRTTRR